MSDRHVHRRTTRRAFLAGGLGGAVALAAGGGFTARALGRGSAFSALSGVTVSRKFGASDGFIRLPGRSEELYVFGFREVPANATVSQAVAIVKGRVQATAPIVAVKENDELQLTLINTGLLNRPDLDDSHTIHWHGFRNAISLFDGVPEVSIAVPVGKSFPYVYRPHDPGTYIYHCHFEDVEHVQMGMTGIVFVRPTQDGSSFGGYTRFAYNDGNGSTGFNREFTLLLNEVWSLAHDHGLHIQESVWTDYQPDFWVINGRAYPDTIKPSTQLDIDQDLPYQPISSLIQVNPGERALLRFASLGYDQHAMQLEGITMKVVGEDATLLRGPGGADLSYETNTVYIGPGESRDVLVTAPQFSGPGETDPDVLPGNPFNRYLLKNRNYAALTNGNASGPGGMMTEVRVYRDVLPAQTTPNQTFV